MEPRTNVTCRDGDTARLTEALAPDAVLLLGDLQYMIGSAPAFKQAFLRSWARLSDVSKAVPGNHEYLSGDADGYFKSLSPEVTGGEPGYYRTAVGEWSVYAVNSNCDRIDCAPEYAWLNRELKSDSACSLMFMHHPRYSTGEHGADPLAETFFQVAVDRGVDIVLSGHDHDYERFLPMNASGRVDRRAGVVQYVSGGGGKSHYTATGNAPGSAFVVDDTYGVLLLELGPKGWTSSFKGIDGMTQDRADGRCH